MHPAAIVTLTMNPALDVSTCIDRLEPERKLRCDPPQYDPGGGGVNVSRTIRQLNGRSLAICALGGPSADTYLGLLEREGVETVIVPIGGTTRQSFTVTETTTACQYRFILPGPALTKAEWRRCLQIAVERSPREGYLVASGSLPPGVPTDFYAQLSKAAGRHGSRVVIDTAGPALAAALDAGVFLIKPSRDELAHLAGIDPGSSLPELVGVARSLIRAERTELVALSLGREGAVLISRDTEIFIPVPEVRVISTVGAGDAFLGGFISALATGRERGDALRVAVAAGTATAMRPSTEVCRNEDVEQLLTRLTPSGTLYPSPERGSA